MVTIASIRSGLRRIAQAVGRTPAGLFRVVIPSSQEPRVYIVALASETASEVYKYLAKELGVTVPVGTDPLILTADEAAALVSLAREFPLEGAASESVS